MALFYEFAIECGSFKEAVTQMANHYDGFHLMIAANEKKVLSTCRVTTWQDSEKNWWCGVLPSGVSVTGRSDQTIKSTEELFELANGLYNRLKMLPVFRYAVSGFEITPFDSYSQLFQPESSAHQRFSGLVLSINLWKKLGSPEGYVDFSPQSKWIPYQPELIA